MYVYAYVRTCAYVCVYNLYWLVTFHISLINVTPKSRWILYYWETIK